MIKKIKGYALVALMVIALAVPAAAAPLVLNPTSASAACSNIANNVSIGANSAATAADTGETCSSDTGVNDSAINKIARSIVTTFSIIVGAISIIMIIYGGFRYITSGGDSGKVGSAKNSLIYAIVGLIIVALAQLIVQFVLSKAGGLTG